MEPIFKIGDRVQIKCDPLKRRLRVKHIVKGQLTTYEWIEYILEDEFGKELHSPDPQAPSSYLEGSLKPAESLIHELARTHKHLETC